MLCKKHAARVCHVVACDIPEHLERNINRTNTSHKRKMWLTDVGGIFCAEFTGPCIAKMRPGYICSTRSREPCILRDTLQWFHSSLFIDGPLLLWHPIHFRVHLDFGNWSSCGSGIPYRCRCHKGRPGWFR